MNMIPVIDLSQFPKNSNQLIEASEQWGCFRLVNHGVPTETMSEMKSVMRTLLDRPMEVKKRNVDVLAWSGYMAPTKTNPLYESLGLYDMGDAQVVADFCDKLVCSPQQREVMQVYAKSIHDLTMNLAMKIAESMGLIGDFFKGWPCQFRINKYNFKPESVGSLGVQLHTDSGFLTIVQDDESVGGLEVMDKSGRFVVVDPLPDSFIVNIGDAATAWSNGRLCAVKHRVQCYEARIRISIATFLLGPKDVNVEAPEDLIDDEHPRLYKPYNYAFYNKFRITNNMHAGEALDLFRASS